MDVKMVVWNYYWLLLLCKGTAGLKLVMLDVPAYSGVGDNVVLHCSYDLQGENLYAVKWYKDNSEFYRFSPRDTPPEQIFQISGNGVDIDRAKSNERYLGLRNLNHNSSGIYRCEVSTEAPTFDTIAGEKKMDVIDPPKDAPSITGMKNRYRIGDQVDVNCSSYWSRPPAHLAWFINGEQALPSMLHTYPLLNDSSSSNLQTSTVGLRFTVTVNHLDRNELRLKCVGSIPPFYQRSHEEVIPGDNPRAPTWESREMASQVLSSSSYNSLRLSHVILMIAATRLIPLILLQHG